MTQKRNTTKILGCHIIQNTKWDCLVFYQDSAWFCIYQIDLKNKGKHNFFIMILWSLFNLLKGWLKFAVSSLVVQWLRLHAPNSGGPGLIPGWGTGSQFSSVTQSCLTLCDPLDCSMPGLPVHHQLPEFTQTYVHWVSDAIQPFHPLLSPSPPTFNLSQHQGVFQWVRPLHQVANGLELQLQHQSFQWIFRTDFL